jgi:N-acetylmuramoyl-L-alanine amidase
MKTDNRRLFVFVALSAIGSLRAATPAITDVRFWSTGDSTRVALEVSGEFHYSTQRITGPERVFFDLETTKLALKSGKQSTIPVHDGRVKQVRLAEKQPGTIRIVFDLEDGVECSASQLSNPDRLMVELHASASAPSVPSTSAPQLPIDPTPAAEKPRASVVAAKVAPAPPVSQTHPNEASPPPAAPSAAPPKPAARNSNGDRSLTRVLGLKLDRVVLDPGHGGHDEGTRSKSGLLEKDLVLDVSQRLAKLLQDRMGTDVILTRTDDTYIGLEERTQLANDKHADLFLSIHANSSPIKNVAGVETFYLNFSAEREDLDLATRENAAAESSIADLKEVVAKIALRAKLDESREFALRVENSLNAAAMKQNKDAKDRGIKKASFVVLIGADMPSVLAEIGFLSNARDEALLKTPEHRDRLAEALYQAIAGYAETLSHATTQVAAAK